MRLASTGEVSKNLGINKENMNKSFSDGLGGRQDWDNQFKESYSSQSDKRGNVSQCTFAFSHSENVKFNHALCRFRKRQQQFQQYQKQSYEEVQSQLTKLESDLQKCREDGCRQIERTIKQLQELCEAATERQEKERVSSTPAIIEKCNQLKEGKITPTFGNLREHIKDKIIRPSRDQFSKLAERLQQRISISIKEEQKQRGSAMLQILNASMGHTQKIEAEIEEMGQWTGQRLGLLEDSLAALQQELARNLQASVEVRQREDRLIEQLVQKLIYKMSYL